MLFFFFFLLLLLLLDASWQKYQKAAKGKEELLTREDVPRASKIASGSDPTTQPASGEAHGALRPLSRGTEPMQTKSNDVELHPSVSMLPACKCLFLESDPYHTFLGFWVSYSQAM
jgi:hypothetical protein